MAEPVEEFHIEHGKLKKADGEIEESPYVLVVTHSRPIMPTQQEPTALLHEIYSADGIESVNPLGRYTLSVQIARTFDPQEVLEDVKAIVKRHASALVLPKDAGEVKIVTP